MSARDASGNGQQPRKRGSSLGPHDMFLLGQWGRQLREAFGATPYLVGSVRRTEDWRDVDVRMDDPIPGLDPLARKTLNVALSLWGRAVTGLPIDFQMQETAEFHSYDGEERGALGIAVRADAAAAAERRATEESHA